MTEETLFAKAMQLPIEERSAFLDRECPDPVLRARVNTMLTADAASSPLMRTTQLQPNSNDVRTHSSDDPDATGAHISAESDVTTGYVPDASSATAELTPTIVGRYRLLKTIGEGGMGSVYLAEQSEPVKRQVALKLIKLGMDSRSVLARFDAERQALAMMDHPNIARIYDGGVTDRGQPFFVMELVQGVPLTKYCDQKRLSVEARLQLFVSICHAVQHAHQKGIIHRDLKPGNVLITEVDGRPTPKVIDFGVAKATEQQLTDMSLDEKDAIVGTPAYMSPEQADPTSMDIDTRTDVYALGVMLYELLVGSTPIDAKQFKRGAVLEMLRMVREEEPPKPSTRLSTANALPSIASNRNIEPTKLSRMLKGELDWVVMKALDKNRERRYESAHRLANDLLRYLSNEVVEARPPSKGYLLRKYVRRNRSAVIAGTIITLAILGGLAGVVVVQAKSNQALEAKNEELLAEKVKVDTANRSLQKANEEIATEKVKVEKRFELAQQAIRTYHTGVSEDAVLSRPELVNLRKRLLSGAATFYTELQRLLEKETDRTSRRMLADGYFDLATLMNSLGDSDQSLTTHRTALELRRALTSDRQADESDRVRLMESLRMVTRQLLAKGQADASRSLQEEQKELAGRMSNMPNSPEARHILAQTLHDTGDWHYQRDERPEAQESFEKAINAWLQLLKMQPDSVPAIEAISISYNNLGLVLGDTGKLNESLEAFRKGLEFRQKLVETSPTVTKYSSYLGSSHNYVALVYMRMRRDDEAVPHLQKAAAIREEILEQNPTVVSFQIDLGDTHYNLARILSRAGKSGDALKGYERCVQIYQRLAENFPEVNRYPVVLGVLYADIGGILDRDMKYPESLIAYQQSLKFRLGLANRLPPAQIQGQLAWTHLMVGLQLKQLKRSDEAMQEFRKSNTIRESLADRSPHDFDTPFYIASTYSHMARLEPKEPQHAEKAMAWLKKAVDRGFKNLESLKTDRDLEPLREREDFKKLLTDLENSLKK